MYEMSSGYDETTNLIWLIGSVQHEQSLISFNLSIRNDTNAMIDYGAGFYPITPEFSQAYVQKESIVYVIDKNERKLLAFDVSTRYLNTTNTLHHYSLTGRGCLASIGDWIIYTYKDNTIFLYQINLDIIRKSNNVSRTNSSCIIEPDSGYL